MRAGSHAQLGRFLAKQYFPHLPAPYLQAFLTGCTQPDKNPTTYFKGSLRNRWLHGHDYMSAKRYLFRLTRQLQQKSTWRLLDYYNFGKLLHYVADAFTYAHSSHFFGNLAEHRKYEQALHRAFLARLTQPPTPYPHIHPDGAETIRRYYHKYQRGTPHFSKDISYIIGICCLLTQMLTRKVKTEIFSI